MQTHKVINLPCCNNDYSLTGHTFKRTPIIYKLNYVMRLNILCCYKQVLLQQKGIILWLTVKNWYQIVSDATDEVSQQINAIMIWLDCIFIMSLHYLFKLHFPSKYTYLSSVTRQVHAHDRICTVPRVKSE